MSIPSDRSAHGHSPAEDASEESLATKRVFTTGEAAAICKISQQTIIRCFDAGRLTGFRVPGSKFRRIPRDELLRFMKTSGIPTDALESGGGPAEIKRILMVDDDPSFIRLVEHAFSKHTGFEVRSAANGYDAGILTESFRPDAIVLDCLLPDVNGNVVCARIRAREDLRACRILGVTASSSKADVDAMMHAGIDAVLHKPLNAEMIVDKVRELLSMQAGTQFRAQAA